MLATTDVDAQLQKLLTISTDIVKATEINTKAINALTHLIEANAKAIEANAKTIEANAKAIKELTNDIQTTFNVVAQDHIRIEVLESKPSTQARVG